MGDGNCSQCGAPLGGSSVCMQCPEELSFTGAGDLPLDVLLPLPGYQLVAELGRGGQGVVFRAVQKSLNRAVAIKVLHPRYLSDRNVRARFKKEAQLLAGLSHENVVAIIDRGAEGQIGFLVMELIEGETLQQQLKREMPSRRRAVEVLRHVAAGLDYCHDRGLVIRDLKPSNLLVNQRGIVKIADFGLAKVIATGDSEHETDTQISKSGQAFGTPRYMSPEQSAARELDHRTDLYSFGLIAYEVLTGPLPMHHLPPASERGVGLPQALDRVIQRMLDPVPDARFQSAGAFLHAVQEALGSSDSEARPASAAARSAGSTLVIGRVQYTPATELAGFALGAVVLGAVIAGSIAPAVAPLAPAVPVWVAPSPAPGQVVARFTLPGPWWLRARGAQVLALATDSLTGATWLARFGPESARGIAPVVERFPLDPVAAELTPDGTALVVATRDRLLARVDLEPGLSVQARAALDFAPRGVHIAADGTVTVASAGGERLFDRALAPGARRPAPPAAYETAGDPPWAWLGWSQELAPVRPDGTLDARRIKVPDGAPGPLGVGDGVAVVPAAGGLAVVPLSGAAAVRRVTLPLPVPISALLARSGEIWAASRHGDSVALVR